MKDADGNKIQSSKLSVGETMHLTYRGRRDGRSGQIRVENKELRSPFIDRKAGLAKEDDRREHERCSRDVAVAREKVARAGERIKDIEAQLDQSIPEEQLQRRYPGEEGLSGTLVRSRRTEEYWRSVTGNSHGAANLRQELSGLRQQNAELNQAIRNREELRDLRCEAISAHIYAEIAVYITAAIRTFNASDIDLEGELPSMLPLTKGVLGLGEPTAEVEGNTETTIEEKGGNSDEEEA